MRRPRCFAALAGIAVAAVAAVGPVGTAAPAGAVPLSPLSSPKADIVVDAGTGRVLIADHPHDPLRPASTAKIITALAAVERIPSTGIVTACPGTAAIETNKIGFSAGTRWPLDEILAAMMMESANDAAYAVGCTIGANNLDRFATVLNETARRLGMKNSTLGDPAGLDTPPSYKGGPHTSAYDLAIATRNALAVPAIAKWAALREYSFTDPQHNPHHFTNHNKMLPGAAFAYAGATGFKTGWTTRATHTLVATATRNGRTLIAVTLATPDSGYAEAAALLDAGFAMPATARGTGETLPPVRVSPYSERAADQTAFAKLGAAPLASVAAAPVVTVPASVPALEAAPRVAAPTTAAAAVVAAAPGSTSTDSNEHPSGAGGSNGLFSFSFRTLLIVVILLCVPAFFLRRRAVKRQRAQRLARKRQRAAAMRSGGLPVVDGRYRTGMRLGKPVESHVRVRRDQRRAGGI
jgi:D-alanyl-D-alanine carboxypeptidase (penicillin-binding protein 5/6)